MGAAGVAAAAVEPRPTRRRRTSRQLTSAIALVLLGLWGAWAVLTWAGAERLVSDEQFRADIDHGRIQTWRLATDLRHRRSWPPDGSPTVDYGLVAQDETTGQPADWDRRPVEGVVYGARDTVGPVRIAGAGHGAPALALVPELRAAGVSQQPLAYEARPSDLAARSGVAAFLIGLAAVVVGPRPVRGTRWFWFWLQWAPLGLGVLLYALGELVRPTGPMRVAGVSGRVNRRRLLGWEGVVAAILASVIVAAGSAIMRAAFGPMWVPGGS